MRRATIRIGIALLTFVIGVGVSHRVSERHIDVSPRLVNSQDQGTIIFEGTVVSIGPSVPASGYFVWYRLAKYRVEHVYYGHYDGTEILVDHLSLSAHELDGINPGDRVCVLVERSKEVLMRTNVSGIREAGEKVKTFYVGGEVADRSSCH